MEGKWKLAPLDFQIKKKKGGGGTEKKMLKKENTRLQRPPSSSSAASASTTRLMEEEVRVSQRQQPRGNLSVSGLGNPIVERWATKCMLKSQSLLEQFKIFQNAACI